MFLFLPCRGWQGPLLLCARCCTGMLCVHWIAAVKTTRVCEEMVRTAIILMRGLIPLLSPHIPLKQHVPIWSYTLRGV